jgi:2-oxoglutarate dehydrogenase E2 component (dihydrolipoamide succinyltransferase)
MTTEIRVPTLGESITEATIAQWYKKPGEAVAIDEPICELETDKVTIEVPAPVAGVLGEVLANDGDTVEVGALLGAIAEGAAASSPAPTPEAAPNSEAAPTPKSEAAPKSETKSDTSQDTLAPSVRRLVDEHGLDAGKLSGTGKDGRLTKADVLSAIEGGASASAAPAPAAQLETPAVAKAPTGGEERVKMTRLRQTIAKRLKDSQNTAAMLTTFNEVDMSSLMTTRREYKEQFEKKHGVKLGFMSFFVKACVVALQEIPAVNAEIDGNEIVYKNYVNMGVAVGTDKGLVVPVLKNAQDMGFAEIEKTIAGFGAKARDGALSIEDLQGGTFTISNGGVYGSLMSTPILNSPQSGILGMHKIQERPVAVNGEVVIRPMMYLALSYDHRIVDGKEAVTYLVRVKEGLENPERLLLNL